MATKPQSSSRHIRRARDLVAKYEVDKANPNEYLTPLQDDWSDLLNRIK